MITLKFVLLVGLGCAAVHVMEYALAKYKNKLATK